MIIIPVLVAVFLAFPVPECMVDGPFLVRAFAHHFFHANIFHLAVNCGVLFGLAKRITKRELIWSYLIGSASIFAAVRPVVGVSNLIYALIGLRTPSFRSRWWRESSTLIFLSVTIVMVFIPQLSATTHLASFSIGAACAMINRRLYGFEETFKKAKGIK